ncbi:MAG: ribosome assembly factor SBDS [Candidatus Kariarchaeaceae archaeon]|jgi:ribosome maturation protein SDO1
MSGIGKSPGDRSTRVDLGKFTLVKYSSHGKRYEIIVDPEAAWLFKQGEDVPIDDIVEGYSIFENISKGLKADIDGLDSIFGTTDEKKIIKLMLENGELQITHEQRKRFLKEKRDEIIEYLVKHAVNPRTKTPHPAARIEKAIDDVGVRIDRKEPTSDQALRVLKEIQQVLPMQIETATIEFVIPAKDTGKMYGYMQGSGDVLKEEWVKDGSLTMIIRVPAGIVAKILEEVSDRSKGRIRSSVIDRAG